MNSAPIRIRVNAVC